MPIAFTPGPGTPRNCILFDHVIKLDGPRTKTLYPLPCAGFASVEADLYRTLQVLSAMRPRESR